MGCLVRPCSYTKLDREDPEELAHRRAQWLIARVLEEADARRRKASMRVKICRLKIRMGRRLKRLRRSIQLSFFASRLSLSRQVVGQLKVWKWVVRGKEAAVSLPPLFG
ncbi:uncharacterized protein [Aristolochia californica]|uniref:uncharacterized protein n=1 Tax=Aristolochia californica TaxID=171875 RepID=UPI0035DFA3CC